MKEPNPTLTEQTMELWFLSKPTSLAWWDGNYRVVVERPTLTDTISVFGW